MSKTQDWNKTGQRKKLICFTMADIAEARGVSVATVRAARYKGILDVEDIRSFSQYILDSPEVADSRKSVTAEETVSVPVFKTTLSSVLAKAKYKKTVREKDQMKVKIGKELIAFFQRKEDPPKALIESLKELGIDCYSSERIQVGDIDGVEMCFNDLFYEKQWAELKVPVHGEDES